MDGANMMSPADIAALTGNNGMNGAGWIWFLKVRLLTTLRLRTSSTPLEDL